MGDEVLTTVSNLILSNVRQTDVAGRLGGEEFAVILVDTSLEAAKKIAEDLREKVKKLRFKEKDGEEFLITMSLGVAGFEKYAIPPDVLRGGNSAQVSEKDQESLIREADQALYHSKENGRDRVTVADPVKPDYE